jgi:hypothetical protein
MRHNSSAISFQTSRMATSIQKFRLPENNYLYKICGMVWRLESDAEAVTYLRTAETQITGHYAYDLLDKDTIHERQEVTMIENFCKASSLEFPPHSYIEQLATHAHACISTYIKLWRIRDEENKIYIEQCNVPHLLNIQPQKFQRDIIDICNEGLMNWSKIRRKRKQYISIELIGWASGCDNEN